MLVHQRVAHGNQWAAKPSDFGHFLPFVGLWWVTVEPHLNMTLGITGRLSGRFHPFVKNIYEKTWNWQMIWIFKTNLRKPWVIGFHAQQLSVPNSRCTCLVWRFSIHLCSCLHSHEELVGGLNKPLWKIRVRQVGWLFHSQLFLEIHDSVMFQSPPTKYLYISSLL